MNKLILFGMLISILSCGGSKETTRETIVQLPEAYIKELEDLKGKIAALNTSLKESQNLSESEKSRLNSEIERLKLEQTNLNNLVEALKSEIPKPDRPKLNLTPEEQMVLDFLIDKMRYGTMEFKVPSPTISPYNSGELRFELRDNYFQTFYEGILEGYNYYSPWDIPPMNFSDTNFIFNGIGYIQNPFQYCEFWDTESYTKPFKFPEGSICNGQFSENPPQECWQDPIVPIRLPCQLLFSTCNLNYTNKKCFQNILKAEDSSFQFEMIPNYKTRICYNDFYKMKKWTYPGGVTYYNSGLKTECVDSLLPTPDIGFKLIFYVNKDKTFTVKDQNGYKFEKVNLKQFFPDKKH